jgi:tRNA1(Val) A37 N6-methylase TrmN6
MSFVPGPPERPLIELTDDSVLDGRLRLQQPRRGHRVGHDAILLAAAVPAGAGELAVDLGAGVGSAGLALATRVAGVRIALVEIDLELAALADENIRRNGFAERARSLTLDVMAPPATFAAAGLPPGSADHVLMNPPFNDPARHPVSPVAGRRLAHAAEMDGLDGWTETARRLLRHGGILTLIWRAEGLAQVLGSLGKHFGSIALRPIYSTATKPAIRVVLRAVKGSRAPLRIVPALLLQDGSGIPSGEAAAILRDAAPLQFFD